MKTKYFGAISAAVITGSTLLSPRANAQLVPPNGLDGTIRANQEIVYEGQKPSLTWNVNYPTPLENTIIITPPKITPITSVYADVRIIGQGVTSSGPVFVPTQATMSINSESDFRQIFYGTNPSVKPSEIVKIGTIFSPLFPNNLIPAGQSLRFGGRYKQSGKWGPYFKSNDGSDNIRFLVDGDTPPTNVPAYNAPSLESFLRPYLDTAGKVKIGPMDVIVFMELTHDKNQKSDPGYDLQDMVLLVTFRKP